MMNIETYIPGFEILTGLQDKLPWDVTQNLNNIIVNRIPLLSDDYIINDNIAIHKTAVIEINVTIKAPAVIGKNCFIGANSYMRNGIWLFDNVKIGTGCEIKTSIICPDSAVAHFNFIGDSIIGSRVNFEAGSITANHFNERQNKTIFVIEKSRRINTGTTKFGSLVGNDCKIGANAVLSPGTMLMPGSIVKRLELIEQSI